MRAPSLHARPHTPTGGVNRASPVVHAISIVAKPHAQFQSCQTTPQGCALHVPLPTIWPRLIGPLAALSRRGLLPAKHTVFFYKAPHLAPLALLPSTRHRHPHRHPARTECGILVLRSAIRLLRTYCSGRPFSFTSSRRRSSPPQPPFLFLFFFARRRSSNTDERFQLTSCWGWRHMPG